MATGSPLSIFFGQAFFHSLPIFLADRKKCAVRHLHGIIVIDRNKGSVHNIRLMNDPESFSLHLSPHFPHSPVKLLLTGIGVYLNLLTTTCKIPNFFQAESVQGFSGMEIEFYFIGFLQSDKLFQGSGHFLLRDGLYKEIQRPHLK